VDFGQGKVPGSRGETGFIAPTIFIVNENSKQMLDDAICLYAQAREQLNNFRRQEGHGVQHIDLSVLSEESLGRPETIYWVSVNVGPYVS
jgi:hypothetical protein